MMKQISWKSINIEVEGQSLFRFNWMVNRETVKVTLPLLQFQSSCDRCSDSMSLHNQQQPGSPGLQLPCSPNPILEEPEKILFSSFAKGPGTEASTSPVSEYWKNWPSVKVFNFVKYVLNVIISNLEPTKMWCYFCKCFLMQHFILKLFPQT